MASREYIAQLVTHALDEAQRKHLLPPSTLKAAAVERSQNPEHGDFGCALPLKLAGSMRMNPMRIAETLVALIPVDGAVERVWAAPPGFINVSLDQSWLAEQVEVIRAAGDSYGSSSIGEQRRVQVEFVSVNPTGPLHVGHTRGAVFGSALANILEAAGYQVEREYYINDAGNQIDKFNLSLYARYRQLFGVDAPVPEDGYQGDYVVDLARELKAEEGERFLDMPKPDAAREIGDIVLAKMVDRIRDDLEQLRVWFDVWFSELSLYANGQYDHAIKVLEDGGFLERREGAVWFASTALGEDKDNVLVRSTGAPTYFASDVAYHYNKFLERKFDRVVNIWGADHQGHVARMKSAAGALGVPPENLTLIIYQLVTFKSRNEIVRASKRTGNIITLRELVEDVGADACRYFFLVRSPESQMNFDLELAKEESSENPVYYIQYAHARIASILRLAEEREIDYGEGDLSLLTHEAELGLVRRMLILPELVEMMARSLEPHHLPHYTLEMATAFHWFYQQCRVVSGVAGEEEITKARLRLIEAAKTVLARCLSLMSMEAPDYM